MIIDYERAWTDLKSYVLSKNSHGQRDLLRQMAQVEIDCRVPEEFRGFDPDPLPSRQNPTNRKPAARALREVTRHG